MERRPIPGLDGFEVDEQGNVFALKRGRLVALRCGWRSNGYRIFYADRKQLLVSRAVCAAFHGPPPTPKHEAAHLDGNTRNNAYTNLAWKTHRENDDDKRLHGTLIFGAKHWAARLNEAQVIEIRRRHSAGEQQRALAREFGVQPQAIFKIVKGHRWRHLPLRGEA